MPAPANDDFANAEVLPGTSGSTTGTTVSATTEASEPAHPMGGTVGPSIWYSWTAPADGYEQFDLAGSGFDTVIEVFTGASIGTLVEVAANDDTYTQNASFVTSRSLARVRVLNGVTYYIRVIAYGAFTTGSVALAWSAFTPSNPYALTPASQSIVLVDPLNYPYTGRWVINIPATAGPFGGDGLVFRFHAPLEVPDGTHRLIVFTLNLINGADPWPIEDGFIFDSANPANFIDGWNADTPGTAGYDYISAGNLDANTNDVLHANVAYDLGFAFGIDPASDPTWVPVAAADGWSVGSIRIG